MSLTDLLLNSSSYLIILENRIDKEPIYLGAAVCLTDRPVVCRRRAQGTRRGGEGRHAPRPAAF